MRYILSLVLILLTILLAPNVYADDAPDAQQTAEQLGWTTIPLEGATCGTGAPYKYFLNASQPDKPLIIYFQGGGACIKSGVSPFSSGVARELYCMNYAGFAEPSSSLLPFYGLFQRGLTDNQFREANYAFIPYCTGDLHSGTATTAVDYNPDPTVSFNVTHRGHLNALAALDNLATRFPSTTQVILTGSSAGGLGSLYHFPDVVSRWPSTRLVTDAGTLPDVPASLVQQTVTSANAPWSPRSLLPEYCNTPACLTSSTRLIAAFAARYSGETAPWRGFGLIQGQQDQTLSDYMEITTCRYQWALRPTLEGEVPANLRYFAPATKLHTFLGAPPFFPQPGLGTYRQSIHNVSVMDWMAQVVNAPNEAGLPVSRADPWPQCAGLFFPWLTGHP